MSELFNFPKVEFLGGAKGVDFEAAKGFNFYNPEETFTINGETKTMKEWLKFSVAYWHTMDQRMVDPFGEGTAERPWDVNGEDDMSDLDHAIAKVDYMFEFMDKLGVEYFAFHDRDLAPEGANLAETNANLDAVVDRIEVKMQETGKKLLWNTSSLFTNKRFLAGGATTPFADVFAYAAAQIKHSLEIAKRLNSESYVFWGGREGYESLLNTDVKRELDHIASFFKLAKDYANEIGYTGQFLIEPKPKEPTNHQYDTDVQTTIAFLKTYGLDKDFKLNLEGNHAYLAGHTYEHEARFAREAGLLGSLDANMGDKQTGWDIDEFPNDIYEATFVMYEFIKNGGLPTGGLNFDSKVRRASFKPEDLFYAHMAGMDVYAAGFRVASKMVEDNFIENIYKNRYASFDAGIGADFEAGKTTLADFEAYILNKSNEEIFATVQSGRLEAIKATVNNYIYSVLGSTFNK
ncbi:MAG: xylose isomerase [Lactobacillaceae bacterium]|jgi:xylose isomerase|nr:xylose isomerase [Lactobacillaceae bacterium]